jgi:hypothetical protein
LTLRFLPTCYHLFSGSRIHDSQRLDPDPLLPVRAIHSPASPEEPGTRGAFPIANRFEESEPAARGSADEIAARLRSHFNLKKKFRGKPAADSSEDLLKAHIT